MWQPSLWAASLIALCLPPHLQWNSSQLMLSILARLGVGATAVVLPWPLYAFSAAHCAIDTREGAALVHRRLQSWPQPTTTVVPTRSISGGPCQCWQTHTLLFQQVLAACQALPRCPFCRLLHTSLCRCFFLCSPWPHLVSSAICLELMKASFLSNLSEMLSHF